MTTTYAGIRLDRVEDAVAAIGRGEAVVVVDDEDRENEGDLIFAASKATPALVGFMIRHTSGYVCVPMEGPDLDRLELPPMTLVNEDRKGTAYAVTVDARDVKATGISAEDRCRTIRVLSDSATEAHDLTRPGHVVPLRALPGGVLRRPGHTEAAVDLARMAGLTPAGALCELVNDDGSMMRAPECRIFADAHGLVMISIADLIQHRRRTESLVDRAAETVLPTLHGQFRAVGYRSRLDGIEHVALVMGEIGDGEDVLVRVHSECLTGDVFGSLRCDCGPQLEAALAAVAGEGRGVVLYMRGHEGRGIGLVHKLQAYQLQDNGSDTVDANLELGLPADARDYGVGAQVLVDLGVRTMRLLTNNPDKRAGLEGYGLAITGRVPLPVAATVHNRRYLETKRDRMGHVLPDLGTDVSGQGAPAVDLTGADVLKVAVVASSWHVPVMDGLVAGAERTLDEVGVTDRLLIRVPGAFELPVVAAELARQSYDAVVALGVVIRGGTPHFEYVCSAATDGLTRIALDTGVPVGFGLLTCDDEQQALARAGLPGSIEDKGREAVEAALATALTLRRLRQP